MVCGAYKNGRCSHEPTSSGRAPSFVANSSPKCAKPRKFALHRSSGLKQSRSVAATRKSPIGRSAAPSKPPALSSRTAISRGEAQERHPFLNANLQRPTILTARRIVRASKISARATSIRSPAIAFEIRFPSVMAKCPCEMPRQWLSHRAFYRCAISLGISQSVEFIAENGGGAAEIDVNRRTRWWAVGD